MFRKLLAAVGIGDAAKPSVAALPPDLPAPYQQAEINTIYNLLFCDELALLQPQADTAHNAWQRALFDNGGEAEAVRRIANDETEESRLRAIAFLWLRQHQHAVPAKQILGVVIEVPLENGLDVIAAYADGRVRYINQTGKMSIFEGGPAAVEAKAKELVAASAGVVGQIGPWQNKRLPAPAAGNIRLSFVVSDGLYFGEGPFALMQGEAMAAPIIKRAQELMMLVVDLATK